MPAGGDGAPVVGGDEVGEGVGGDDVIVVPPVGLVPLTGAVEPETVTGAPAVPLPAVPLSVVAPPPAAVLAVVVPESVPDVDGAVEVREARAATVDLPLPQAAADKRAASSATVATPRPGPNPSRSTTGPWSRTPGPAQARPATLAH